MWNSVVVGCAVILILGSIGNAEGWINPQQFNDVIHNLWGITPPPPVDLGRANSGRKQLDLFMQKPPGMVESEYSVLSTLDKRLLPDYLNRDRQIDRQQEGKPVLNIRFNQVREKRRHNIEFGLKPMPSGTPKNDVDKEAEKLCQKLYQMAFDDVNVEWYTNGGYQSHKYFDSVNVFDKRTNQVAIYIKRANGENTFLSTMTLNRIEREHLFKTKGIVMTQKALANVNPESIIESTDLSPNPIINSETMDFDTLGTTIDINKDEN